MGVLPPFAWLLVIDLIVDAARHFRLVEAGRAASTERERDDWQSQ